MTTDYAQLNVQGPRSRDVLADLTATDLSTEAFGFRSAGWVELAGVRLLLARITYLGELGYELYVPAGDALKVYDAVQPRVRRTVSSGGAQSAGVAADGEGLPRLRP